jgi:hypothetical protein
LHFDAVTDTADGSAVVTAFIADLEAFSTRGRWACRPFVSRNRALAIAVARS